MKVKYIDAPVGSKNTYFPTSGFPGIVEYESGISIVATKF
jgi:hypothetical protein